MKLTAKELSGAHLLSKVTIPFEGQRITGQLADLHHEVDLIADYPLCAPVTYSRGRQWVAIELAGNFEDGETISTRLQPDTPITIQEGQ